MRRSKTYLIVLGLAALLLTLAVLRFKPWRGWRHSTDVANGADSSRPQLGVGFLPVT